MLQQVVEQITAMVKQVDPAMIVEYDAAYFMNVKADTIPRYVEIDVDGVPTKVSNSFVHIEEPTSANLDLPYRGYDKKRIPLRIYFCKFEEFDNDASSGDTDWSKNSPDPTKRAVIREQIEQTMLFPFLYLLKHSRLGMEFPDLVAQSRLLYPRSRFDAHEVAVGLEITLTETVCLDNYKPL